MYPIGACSSRTNVSEMISRLVIHIRNQAMPTPIAKVASTGFRISFLSVRTQPKPFSSFRKESEGACWRRRQGHRQCWGGLRPQGFSPQGLEQWVMRTAMVSAQTSALASPILALLENRPALAQAQQKSVRKKLFRRQNDFENTAYFFHIFLDFF